MVNINIAGVLDYTIGKWTDPATSNHPAAPAMGKSNLRCRSSDEGFGAAVLAIAIGVTPAVTEG